MDRSPATNDRDARIAGRFEPLALLGSGATARVDLVVDRARGGPPLALKRVPASKSAFALDEFRRLHAFRLAGIPRAYELLVDPRDGDHLFTSEPGSGRPFLAALRGAPQRVQLLAIADLLRTLALLDERGVVHRDLKPDHLLVEASEPPRVVVVDFGLSTQAGAAGAAAGSLPYLAPELFLGGPPSHATDLYALGVVLFELWAGELPLRAADANGWARAHLDEPVRFDGRFAATPPLREIVARLLAKDPESRYQHAAHVLADLSRASPEPLPRTTVALLLGRIRSVPPIEPPWREALVAGDARPGGTLTWVTAPTRRGRDDLMRELRSAAALGDAWPIVVPFVRASGADGARAGLVAQLAALRDPAASGADDEALLARLQRGEFARRLVLFLEEADARAGDDDALLRFLLRARVELVVSGSGEPRADAVVSAAIPSTQELRTISPRPLAAGELARLFPAWLGHPLPALLGRWLGADAPADVARIVELLCHAVESGALTYDVGGLHFDATRVDVASVAGDVLDVVRRRLAGLDERRRALLEALAVWDADATRDDLEALVPGHAAADLEALAAAGLVQTAGGLVRVAECGVGALVAAALDPAVARRLHAAAASRLAASRDAGDRELRAARHRLRADRGSATAARDLATAALALVDAERLAPADAAAREVVETTRDGAALRVARLVRAIVELRRSSHAAAEAELAPLVDEFAAANDPLLGRALVEHARALDRCGRPADALARLAGGGVTARAAPGAAALRAYLLHQLQRDGEAEEACRAALAGPRVAGDGGETRLRSIHAVTLWRLERFEEARAAFESALASARASAQPLQASAVEGNLARFEEDCGRPELAARLFRRALATAAAFGDRQQEAMLAQNLANTLFDLGRFDECKLEMQRSREIAHAMSRPSVLRRLELMQAHVALNEGDFAAAHVALDASGAIARSIGDAAGAWRAELVRTEVLLREGRLRDARRLVAAVGADPAAAGNAEMEALVAEYRLQWATWGGTRGAVESALAAFPPLPRSPRRRAFLRDAQLAARQRLGRHDEVARDAEEQLRELVGSDFVALRARAAAAAALAAVRRRGRERASAEVERAQQALAAARAPGFHALRSEAVLALGAALGDARLLEEAVELGRRGGHRPVARRAALLARRLAARTSADPASAARLASLEALVQFAKTISATDDGETLLRLVLDHAVEATRARRGFLILERGGELGVRVARNLDAADIERPELAYSSSIARSVARDGRPVLLSDVSSDERYRAAASISQLKLISVLCVPLRVRDAAIGSLYLDEPTRIDAFREPDLRYVENLSDFAAIALDKSRLLDAVRARQSELERTQQEIARLNRELQASLIEKQGELREMKASLDQARRTAARVPQFEGIVSQSAAMEEVKRRVELFAGADFPVLVSGESGTGKELVARAVHQRGARRERPFELLNCATTQPTLIENELFGHQRGAYTGAVDDQPGLFERADGGTVFLDEIGEASPELQAKLLRVVQSGELQRLGGGPVRRVDVRIVAASNRDLRKEVAAGRFREDLMFRLMVLQVQLPPLRERREDVPLLLEHFVAALRQRMDAEPLRFTPAAWRALVQYGWPGNVRELEHVVQRLLVVHRGGAEIGVDALRSELPDAVAEQPERLLPLRDHLDEQERAYVREVLARCSGNRAKAAAELGISERNLYQRLQRMR